MDEFPLMVRSVAAESIDISTLDGRHGVTPGRVTVEFDGPNGVTFEVDWTHRGTPPAVGSRWTLVRSEATVEDK